MAPFRSLAASRRRNGFGLLRTGADAAVDKGGPDVGFEHLTNGTWPNVFANAAVTFRRFSLGGTVAH